MEQLTRPKNVTSTERDILFMRLMDRESRSLMALAIANHDGSVTLRDFHSPSRVMECLHAPGLLQFSGDERPSFYRAATVTGFPRMNPEPAKLSYPQGQKTESFPVGIEVGPAIIRAGVFDSDYHLLGKTKITTRPERGSGAVIERIVKCLRYAVDECDLSMSQLSEVGIAVSGRISRDGVVESCPELLWEDVPLQAALTAQLDAKLQVGQIHRLAALSIRSLEINRPVPRFAAIFLAPQIGAGISIDDQWQDLTALPHNPEEEDALSRNILATLPQSPFTHYRGRDFRKALRKAENIAVRNYVAQIAEAAGICAARIHRQYSPGVIAVGGGLIDEMKDDILAIAQASFERAVQATGGTLPLLLPSRLGDLAAITGAAIWANEKRETSMKLMAATAT